MHNKSFTVDSQSTITGGRNIGDEYFSAHELSNFQDIDVIATGPVVKDIGRQFDTYWNSDVVYPVAVFEHNSATDKSLLWVKKTLNDFAALKKNPDTILIFSTPKCTAVLNGDIFQTSMPR